MQAIPPRRVKVYILNGEDWIDNGTGYCTGEIDEKNNIPFFIVRNELDQTDVILKAYIEGTTQYQQQQETLIVWTDELGRDIALSFQEPNGCTLLCDFLIDVFQHYQPNISLVAVISNNSGDGAGDITELIVGPVELPPLPTMKNLQQVAELLNQGASSNYSKDQITNFILENDYVPKLIEIFNRCETQHRLLNLHFLCDIMKILFMYSNTQIIEVLLNDSNIMGVVGILEYDPEFPEYKSNHREYLSDETKFKEVIPVEDPKVEKQIKSTFRLQFLKDVILAKLIDDATFNLIQTLIYINQFDVIKYLQEPNGYMEKLFSVYDEGSSADLETKRDGVRMLHQFVLIAKTLQINQKSEFYKSLVSKGLFKMINFSLKDESTKIRVLCTELIVSIIEHDVALVNEAQDVGNGKPLQEDMALLVLLTRLLVDEKDIGLKTQAFEAIKVLLDPWHSSGNSSQQEQHLAHPFGDDDVDEYDDVLDNGVIKSQSHAAAAHDDAAHGDDSRAKDDDYITSFYEKSAPAMFEPLVKLSKITRIDRREDFAHVIDNESLDDSILFQHLCELVNFCALKHDKNVSRKFMLENDILMGLKNLVHKTFKMQLRLSAIRSIKSIISLDDELYTGYIISNDVLEYVAQFDLTANNLAVSTVLSIIDIEDVDRDTEEKKSHYDTIMAYINKLIKYEEEALVEDVETEVMDTERQEAPPKGKKTKSVDEPLANKLKREVSAESTITATGRSKKVKWVKRLFNKSR